MINDVTEFTLWMWNNNNKCFLNNLEFVRLSSFVIFINLFLVILTGTMFKIQLTNQVEVNSEEITVTFNDVKGVSLLL